MSTIRVACGAWVLSALACGTAPRVEQRPSAQVTPDAAPPPTLIATDVAPLYPAPDRPPLTRRCSSAKRTPRSTRAKMYDFDEWIVEPLPYGPRIADRPPRSPPRSLREIEGPVKTRDHLLHDCYRWARQAAPDLDVTLPLHVVVDELGKMTFTIEPPDGASKKLAKCAVDVLAGLRVQTMTPRTTVADLTLGFHRSGQKLPKRRPPRPEPPAGNAGAIGCVAVADVLPTDHVTAADPTVEVTDFDKAQADAEAAAERKKACKKDKSACHYRVPHVIIDRVGPVSVSPDIDKRMIRALLRANEGAYRACYIDALARSPELSGTVVLKAFVGLDGKLTSRVESDDVGDPPLASCLDAAMEAVTFPSNVNELQLVMPFQMTPLADPLPAPLPARAEIEEVERWAAAAIARGDGEGALRAVSALLAGAPEHAHACRWRRDALAAVMVAAPWLDERTDAAVADLLATAGADHACLVEALPLLEAWADDPFDFGDRLYLDGENALAVERYQRLVALDLALPEGDRLLDHLERALRNLDRQAEANALPAH